VAFMLALWAKETFGFLFSNPDFKKFYPLGILILVGYCYRPYYWYVLSRLQFSERTSQFWKISLIAGLVNVILNIVFIPFYGIYASTIATFISLIYMGFAGFFLQAYKEINTYKQPYRPLLMIVLIVLVTVLSYYLKDISGWLKVVISLFCILFFIQYSRKNKHIFYDVS
jgi:O-antigen/teichoic acid export membrane protein